MKVMFFYIADTGAGARLLKWVASLKMKPNSKPVRFITASGEIDSLGKCVKELKLLGETMFQVLQDTPNVLSVGRIVRESDIAFHWPIDGPPYFETQDGETLSLRAHQDVPYFSESDVDTLLK